MFCSYFINLGQFQDIYKPAIWLDWIHKIRTVRKKIYKMSINDKIKYLLYPHQVYQVQVAANCHCQMEIDNVALLRVYSNKPLRFLKIFKCKH